VLSRFVLGSAQAALLGRAFCGEQAFGQRGALVGCVRLSAYQINGPGPTQFAQGLRGAPAAMARTYNDYRAFRRLHSGLKSLPLNGAWCCGDNAWIQYKSWASTTAKIFLQCNHLGNKFPNLFTMAAITTEPSADSARKMNIEQLIKRISTEYEGLSRQLKVIARYVEQHRDHLGLEGIQDVATQCDVQPSAVVRFAKHFGFSGFSEMQAIFRDGLSRQLAPSRTYKGRIRDVIESGAGNLSSAGIAREFLSGSIAGMQELQNGLQASPLQRAVDLLAKADCIWIAASRRSFSIAAYLDYALQHTDKRIALVTGMGHMHLEQMRSVRRGDVMIVVSFSPYAEETMAVAQEALARGARTIAITDSRMSPLARDAASVLVVQENSTFGFRSLTSTMGLAQSLFIALAYKLELSYQSGAEPKRA
jgi:DNA-binding MurR/RpiR family transcriptional regulator